MSAVLLTAIIIGGLAAIAPWWAVCVTIPGRLIEIRNALNTANQQREAARMNAAKAWEAHRSEQ